MSLHSLLAFGATSRDLVVGSGQWWRIALAPILHASTSHVVGNSFALAFVGFRLEPMIGRGWFLLIFVVSALGGVAGSLYGNDPGIASLGASGAITGLLAALFVMSFNPYADVDQQRAMRRTALRFGVPALLRSPGARRAASTISAMPAARWRAARSACSSAWSGRTTACARTLRGWPASIALAGFAGSLLATGFAATHYSAYAAEARQFIRLAEMPKDMRAGAKRSADLLARYPKDPVAHLIRAVSFLEEHRLDEAEGELRDAISVAGTGSRPAGDARPGAGDSGRRPDGPGPPRRGQGLGGGNLPRADSDPMKRVMAKAKLCG